MGAIARAAGVSRTVASYVFHGQAGEHRVAATTTQERVQGAIRKMGCTPDLTLRCGRRRENVVNVAD
ncbi:MAG: LacI family DNA-binding transcriptional regulator [Chloroflexi bacterium]|nr:LacI family DNA-binding transcriptional regulator [Chloroflexota bacterium]